MINEVVTVMTSAGEYVGKLVEQTNYTLELSNPRLIVTTEQGMGFASGIAMTSGENAKQAVFRDYIFVTEANEQVADAWLEQTSGIVLPKASGIIGA